MKIGKAEIELSHNGKIVCISIEAVDEKTAKDLFEDFTRRLSHGELNVCLRGNVVEVEEIPVQ